METRSRHAEHDYRSNQQVNDYPLTGRSRFVIASTACPQHGDNSGFVKEEGL